MSRKNKQKGPRMTNTPVVEAETQPDEITNEVPMADPTQDPVESYSEPLEVVGAAVEVPIEEPPTPPTPFDEPPTETPIETPAEPAVNETAIEAKIEAAIEAFNDEPPVEQPVETPVETPPDTPPQMTDAEKIARLEAMVAQLTAIKSPDHARRINSGSKPRQDLMYQLLAKTPAATNTPQVQSIQRILFDPLVLKTYEQPSGEVLIPENKLFELIEAGHREGKLITRQPPVRIFQYYRNDLRKLGVLGWKNA